jgi:CheY-like chemotaxis protein
MSGKSEQKGVFIIEDDAAIIEMYKKTFLIAGYNVATAMDGEEALKKIKGLGFVPDLILLDYKMPKLSGGQVLKKIKEDAEFKEFKNIPIVILTNLVSLENEGDLDRLMALGAVTYFIKSDCDPSKIVEEVAKIISKQV